MSRICVLCIIRTLQCANAVLMIGAIDRVTPGMLLRLHLSVSSPPQDLVCFGICAKKICSEACRTLQPNWLRAILNNDFRFDSVNTYLRTLSNSGARLRDSVWRLIGDACYKIVVCVLYK